MYQIDALAGDRSGGTMHEASRRILSVLLQKVEGFSSAKKTTVICATNRYVSIVFLAVSCQVCADTLSTIGSKTWTRH